jgi:folate-binding protein YgfZ
MNTTWLDHLRHRGATVDSAGVVSFGDGGAEAAAIARGTMLCDLSHYALIRFSGEDSQQYLQNQLSCDVDAMAVGTARYGGYCTPQGRMLASFMLWKDETGYSMQLPRSLVTPIRKRLATYILRSKVTAVDASDEYVLLGIAGKQAEAALRHRFENIPSAPLRLTVAQDATVLRLGAERFQVAAPANAAPAIWDALGAHATPVGSAAWDWLQIRQGIPVITPATQEQFVPQMANLDLLGGVSFSKGCYPGQEIVARMHYLGKLKQRMYLANIGGKEAPQPGDKLYSADKENQATGMVVNAAPSPDGGYDVLAVIQIESARQSSVHWQSLAGPPLRLLDLPYKL